jgi:ABC-type multidrug transport system fused ATPase/permease subunit
MGFFQEFHKINRSRIFLTKKENKNFFFIIFLAVIYSLFEILGLGLIFAITITALQKDFYIKYQDFIENFLYLNSNNYYIFFIIFFIIFYFLKSIYHLYFHIIFNQFIFSIKRRVSDLLFEKYTKIEWINFVENNSSFFIRNILVEIGIYVGAIQQLLFIFSEIIFLFGILIILLYFNPLIILTVVIVLIFFSFLIYFLLKKNLKKISKFRQEIDEKKLKNLTEVFGAMKILKLMPKVLLNIFDRQSELNFEYSKIETTQTTIQSVPKILFELIFIISVSLGFLFIYFFQLNIEQLLPQIVLFVACSFKILPSIQKLLNCNINLNSSSATVDLIILELKNTSETALKEKKSLVENKFSNIYFNKFIEMRDVSFSFKSMNKASIRNINLTINKGSIVGIIGETGSGKTTLLDILIGLIKADSGKILVDGTEINNEQLKLWQNKFAYITQKTFLFDDSIVKNIIMSSYESLDDKRLEESIRISKLKDLIYNQDNSYALEKIGEYGLKLSGGQQQRIGIARALYMNKEILIMDEPTSSLDEATEKEIIDCIYSLKNLKTVIIISHKNSILTGCDSIYKIKSGEVEKVK